METNPVPEVVIEGVTANHASACRLVGRHRLRQAVDAKHNVAFSLHELVIGPGSHPAHAEHQNAGITRVYDRVLGSQWVPLQRIQGRRPAPIQVVPRAVHR